MHKRGLSAVVTTLIIILLVLVAIGIVWVIVRNIILGGAEGIELSTKCLNTNVKTTVVDCSDPAACKVTFERTGSNNDAIAGVKLVFFNETGNSGVIDELGNIEILAGKTITINSTLSVPNKLEVTAYFEDTFGSEKPCSTTSFNIGIGSSGGEENGGGNGNGNGNGCIPDLDPCGSLGYVCGNITNGTCGTISCPPGCTGTDICSNGVCVPEDCVNETLEETCGDQGRDCGNWTNNCGYIIDCGNCTVGECIEGSCVIEASINSGTVDSVWPSGAVKYFDSEDLPKNSTILDYNLNYVKFTTGSEMRCLQITWAEYLIEYNKSYVRLIEVAYIISNDSYEIWETQEGCAG